VTTGCAGEAIVPVDARPHQSLLPSASERAVDLYQGLELAEVRLR
jgi:hypothetical protein